MKKSILAVVGLAAVAGVVAPMGAALAVDISLTDTLALTIDNNCAFTRATEGAHTGSTWTEDAFAAVVTNGSTNDNIAKSKFTVVCNNVKGYQVTVAPTGFTAANISGAASFAYNAGGYAAEGSSWYIGGLQTANDNLVKKETAATAGTTFEVTYNAKVSSTQQADTYNASAVYTFAQLNS